MNYISMFTNSNLNSHSHHCAIIQQGQKNKKENLIFLSLATEHVAIGRKNCSNANWKRKLIRYIAYFSDWKKII